jgi:hypothetical protein
LMIVPPWLADKNELNLGILAAVGIVPRSTTTIGVNNIGFLFERGETLVSLTSSQVSELEHDVALRLALSLMLPSLRREINVVGFIGTKTYVRLRLPTGVLPAHRIAKRPLPQHETRSFFSSSASNRLRALHCRIGSQQRESPSEALRQMARKTLKGVRGELSNATRWQTNEKQNLSNPQNFSYEVSHLRGHRRAVTTMAGRNPYSPGASIWSYYPDKPFPCDKIFHLPPVVLLATYCSHGNNHAHRWFRLR